MADFPGSDLCGMIVSLFFVLLTMKQPDDFRVVGPAAPVLARVGEEALLTCQLRPERTATHMEVRWYRSEPDGPLLAHRPGAGGTGPPTEARGGRVEMVEERLAEGRAALRIRDVRASDDGQYRCRFQEDGDAWGETGVRLRVAGLGSAPSIHMEGPGEGGVQLVCTARGWFPEPQVYWEDMSGERLMTLSEDHVPGGDGLFYVEDTLVVRNDAVKTVSCIIHNPVLAEGKEATISLPEKLQAELAASLRVTGPSGPIPVRVGDDLELPCSLTPAADARGVEVRWVRSLRYPAVYAHVDGAAVPGEQMADYRGRTSLVGDGVREGRLALRVHDVRTSDDGWYRCLFEKDGVYREATVEVQVFAVGSSPLITREELGDGETQLRCTSAGWFPRPRVQWRDAEGRTLPSTSETLQGGSRELFRVETVLLVTNRSTANVTCSISNLPLGQEKAASFCPWESRMACLWKTLPVLGLLLALGVGLARRKTCPRETVTLDPNTTHPKPFHGKGHKGITHEPPRPSSPTPRRALTSCSQSPRRGSRQGYGTERWKSGMGLGRS